MSAFGTILKWIILLPVLAVILLLAVANGQDVTVHLNPFAPSDPVLSYALPLYQLGFILFVLGVLTGGLVAWTGQIRHRRRQRLRREEASQPPFTPRDPQPARAGPASSVPAGFLPRPERS